MRHTLDSLNTVSCARFTHRINNIHPSFWLPQTALTKTCFSFVERVYRAATVHAGFDFNLELRQVRMLLGSVHKKKMWFITFKVKKPSLLHLIFGLTKVKNSWSFWTNAIKIKNKHFHLLWNTEKISQSSAKGGTDDAAASVTTFTWCNHVKFIFNGWQSRTS